jgi:hypothetical protein
MPTEQLVDRFADIVRHIRGEPNRARSTRTTLRWGTNGSLAVEIAGPKKGTWFDHENNEGGGVLDFIRVELHLQDEAAWDWLDRELGIKRRGSGGGNTGPLATYTYVDHNGNILFWVYRWPGKRFSQAMPGNGTGGIKRSPKTDKPSMQGCRYVPYHLDELVRASAAQANGAGWRVYIVEGEKDADRLRHDWGLTATCNAMGAGKWKNDYARYFGGADAVIIPDNDDTGRAHAQQVAQSLLPVARSVKILPMLVPEKGDVSDAMDNGMTQSDLEELVQYCEALAKGRVEEPPEPPPQWPLESPQDFAKDPAALLHRGVTLNDFFAVMPEHKYIYIPNRDLWPTATINGRFPKIAVTDSDGNEIKLKPAQWLDMHRPVEQLTWAPGKPLVIDNRLINQGGWIERDEVRSVNLYLPPTMKHGDAGKARRWLRHLLRVYPDKADARHIVCWLAHRVQHPEDKINHALVLGGNQGIGKDTIVEPVKRAIGPWNGQEENPKTILERQFTGYLKGVILRISEARDVGDSERRTFYEHMKAIIVAPPDVLRINEKHLREYYIPNVVGVIITTNHKTDGIHLPEDDRRHYVAWSPRHRDAFPEQYFIDFYRWLDDGGDRHVAAYLAQVDLSGFNPKAPPPQTQAFWEMVNAVRVPENSELADLLDGLGNPAAVTIARIVNSTKDPYGTCSEFGEWLRDRRNRRKIPYRMESCGYVAVKNPDAKDGFWKILSLRHVIYGKISLSPAARLTAAQALTRPGDRS